MPIAFNSIRVGHCYRIVNYGDRIPFVVLEILNNGDIKAKHLETLEVFLLTEIIRYGKGIDYDLTEFSS